MKKSSWCLSRVFVSTAHDTEGTIYVIKGEKKTQTQEQNLESTMMTFLQEVLGGKKLAGLTNQHLTGYKTFYEMEPIASTAQVCKKL